MKHEHQNPREGIRINLPFDDAIRRALNTPPEPSRKATKPTRRKSRRTKAGRRVR